MNFRVGQKVVCVDASKTAPYRRWLGDPPVEGEIYTVSGFVQYPDGPGLTFKEIKNTDAWNGGYMATRFRPVVERKTDIAIFTALLNPINHKHLEGV